MFQWNDRLLLDFSNLLVRQNPPKFYNWLQALIQIWHPSDLPLQSTFMGSAIFFLWLNHSDWFCEPVHEWLDKTMLV